MHERFGPSSRSPGATVSSIGTMSGGSLAIRGSPSTRCVSLPSARRLSLRTRLRHVVLEALALLALPVRRPARGDVLDVEPGVPELHRAHAGEARHRVAVRARDREVDRVTLFVVESAVAPSDGEACGEPLDVPLERPRKRLVEVVDAEDHPPVRCGEDAEVGQVRVAAQLDVQPGARLFCEVRRHEGGGASVEGERRHEHAAVADGHELLEARLRLVLQQLDGVPPALFRAPFAVNAPSDVRPRGLAAGGAVLDGEVLHGGSARARTLALHGTPVARTLGLRGQEAAHTIAFVRTAATRDIAQWG